MTNAIILSVIMQTNWGRPISEDSGPKKRLKALNICGRCGAQFYSKANCFYHMDFECPKRPKSK